ncbi:helix-turn-helix domain-containing protein, partial [Nocardia cyriacigeorgica]
MDGSLFSPVVELRRAFEALPGFLRTPIELVVFGGELPRADISGMRRLADELRARSAELDDHSADLASLLKQEDSVGELAENLRAALRSYRKDAARLGKDVDALADQAQGAANDAEKWLCVMFTFGIHLAWRIYGLIAAAAASGPAGQVAAAPAVQATLAEGRAEVAVMRGNLHRAVQAGGAQTAARLSGLGPAQFAKWMGVAVALPVGVDAGVQALQVATGDRTPEIMGADGSNPTGIDLTSIKVAALAGAGGAVGGMLAGRFAPMVFPQIATSRVAMGLVQGVAGGISGLGAASLIAGWPQHYEQVLGPLLNGAFAGGIYARSASPPAVDGAGTFTPPEAISTGRDENAAARRPPVEVSPESKRAWEAARQSWKPAAETADSAKGPARPPAEGARKAEAAQPQSGNGRPTGATSSADSARTARATDGRMPDGSGSRAPEGTGNRAPEGTTNRAPEGTGNRAPEGAGNRAPEGTGSRAPEGTGSRTSGTQATAGAVASDSASARPRPEPTATGERPPAEKPAAGRASVPRSAEAAGETSPPPTVPASARPDGGVPDKAGIPAREHTAVADGAGNTAPARPHPVDGEAGSPRVHDDHRSTSGGEQSSPPRNAAGEHDPANPTESKRTDSAGDGAETAAAGADSPPVRNEDGVPAADQGGRTDGADASAGSPRSYRDRAVDLLADYHAASADHVPEGQRLRNLPADVVLAGLRSGDEHQSMLATMEIIRRGTISEKVPDGMVLRLQQAEAVFAMPSRPVEMKPGEGKALVFTAAAIQRAVQHDSVLLVTTTDGLAYREVVTYRKLLADFGIDVFRADQQQGFGPITEGRPAIVVATGETVGHLANAGIKPPRHVLIDEIDGIIDRGERQFLRSEGPEQPASEATTKQVFAAHDFLTEAIANNKLSHEDFGLNRIAEEIGVHADGTPEVVYWYDGQPELTPGGRAKLEALPGGKDWLEGMGASRLEAAAQAEFLVRRGVHYEMDAGKIVIIDQAEHGLQRNPKMSSESRWSAEPGKASLAQAIEAKEFRAAKARGESPEQHQIVVRADTESAKRIDSVEIYRVGKDSLFDEVTGASGTLTDLNPVLQKVYGLEPAHEIARSQPHRLVEGQHDVVESTHAKLRTIAEYANEMRDGGAGRFQEILVHRNDLVERQVEALVRAGVPREAIEAVDAKRIIGWGADWEAQLQKVFDEAGEQGKILVINRQGQRGVDISVSDEVRAKGGMHVWMTETPEQSYIHEQAKNRTARNGQLGSAQVVMTSQDALIRNAMHLRGVRETVVHYEQAVAAHEAAPTPRTHEAVVEARQAIRELVPELQQRALRHSTSEFIRHHAFSTTMPTVTLAEADTGLYRHADEVDFTRPDGPADRTARLAGLLGVPAESVANQIAALERTDVGDPMRELLHRAGITPAAAEALSQHVEATAPAAARDRAVFGDEDALIHTLPLRNRLAEQLGIPIPGIDGAEGMRTLDPELTEARAALAAALGYPVASVTPTIARDILGEAVGDHLSAQDRPESERRTDADTAAPDSGPVRHNSQAATHDTTVQPAADAASAQRPTADDATAHPAAAQKSDPLTSTVDHGSADDIVAAASRYLALSALLDLVVQIHRRSPNSCVNNAVTGMRVLCPDNADRCRVPPTRLGGYGRDDVRRIFDAGLEKSGSLHEVVESLESRPGGITVLVYKWKDTRANGTSIEADDHMVLLVNDSTSVDDPNLLVVDLAASRDRDTANDYGPKDLRNRRTLLNKAVGFDEWLRDQKDRISLPAEQQRFETIEFDRDGNLVPRLRTDAPEAEKLPPEQRVVVPSALQDDINAIPAGRPGLGDAPLVRSGSDHRSIGSRPSHSGADPSSPNSASALNRARGAWIAARRQDKNRRDGTTMTAADLARAVGVNRSTMSRIEQGSTRPRPGLFVKIGRALGVPATEFVDAARDLYPDADFDLTPAAYPHDAPGRWLSAVLHDRDMSWEELADASGISAKYLNSIGKGETVPGAAVFLSLGRALGLGSRAIDTAAERFFPGTTADLAATAYAPGEPGLWLRAHHVDRGISGEELAQAAGIDTEHLRSVERAERNLGLVDFLALGRALGLERETIDTAADRFFPGVRVGLDPAAYAPEERGRWFRAFRYDRGMSLEQLAAAAGISTIHLRSIEAGDRVPGVVVFLWLCDALSIETDVTGRAAERFYPEERFDLDWTAYTSGEQ